MKTITPLDQLLEVARQMDHLASLDPAPFDRYKAARLRRLHNKGLKLLDVCMLDGSMHPSDALVIRVRWNQQTQILRDYWRRGDSMCKAPYLGIVRTESWGVSA